MKRSLCIKEEILKSSSGAPQSPTQGGKVFLDSNHVVQIAFAYVVVGLSAGFCGDWTGALFGSVAPWGSLRRFWKK